MYGLGWLFKTGPSKKYNLKKHGIAFVQVEMKYGVSHATAANQLVSVLKDYSFKGDEMVGDIKINDVIDMLHYHVNLPNRWLDKGQRKGMLKVSKSRGESIDTSFYYRPKDKKTIESKLSNSFLFHTVDLSRNAPGVVERILKYRKDHEERMKAAEERMNSSTTSNFVVIDEEVDDNF